MTPAETHGKRVAVVAWAEKPDGSDDFVVFAGIADWDGSHLTLLRQPGKSPFPIPDEWLGRLKLVEPDLKTTLLGADYCLSVAVGNLPDSHEVADFLKSDLRWPADDDAS
jgi:hypothetical protein